MSLSAGAKTAAPSRSPGVARAPSTRLQLGRPVPSHPYRLFPISDQVAEKVTATMSTYNGRPSSRAKDLVDIVTIARTQRVDLRELGDRGRAAGLFEEGAQATDDAPARDGPPMGTEGALVRPVTHREHVCTSSNQSGPMGLFRKRDFLPVHRPARCA